MHELDEKNKEIIEKAKIWFRTVIAVNHIKNTQKLIDPRKFDINPFLVAYIATFLDGDYDETSIARALVLPRTLGTSITTSFGQNMQGFVTGVLAETFGSIVPGIDIEFMDQIEGIKKFCQVKLGPNTINKDDVESIHGHFSAAKNLARTNSFKLSLNDLTVAVLYGEVDRVSTHYRNLRDIHHYNLLVGRDFWHHLTGHVQFYDELIAAISSVAKETKGKCVLEETIQTLARHDSIKKIAQQ
jgi:hypothetical protein